MTTTKRSPAVGPQRDLTTPETSSSEQEQISTERSRSEVIKSGCRLLKSLDPELWEQKYSCRIVQAPLQPMASLEPVETTHDSLLYRGVYYYSDNPEFPYVGFMKSRDGNLPLVSCFHKKQIC